MLSWGQVNCLIAFYRGARMWPWNQRMGITLATLGRNAAWAELDLQLMCSCRFNYNTKIIASHATKKFIPKASSRNNLNCRCKSSFSYSE